MQDLESSSSLDFTPDVGVAELSAPVPAAEEVVVSTHVLVPADQVEKLRLLAKKSRVAQSEYLREAVEDLLRKYHAAAE